MTRRARFELTKNTTLPLDQQFIGRLIDAYRAQRRDAPRLQGDVGPWSDLGWQGNLEPLTCELDRGNALGVSNILEALFQTQCPYGIAMGKQELDEIVSTKSATDLYEEQWSETLRVLAEELGAVPVSNPEIGAPQRLYDAQELARRVEAVLGMRLSFPQFFGVYGCKIKNDIVPRIAFFHLLAAVMCARWLDERQSNSVVEIGGGFGGLCLYLSRLTGVNYIALDVPAALTIQAAFVAAGNSQIEVRLYGEGFNFSSQSCVNFVPSWTLANGGCWLNELRKIDLIINQDSLSDLPSELATVMMRGLVGRLAGLVLSISPDISVTGKHGAHLRDVMIGLGLQLWDRAPFQIRPGYMREIFVPRRSTSFEGNRIA